MVVVVGGHSQLPPNRWETAAAAVAAATSGLDSFYGNPPTGARMTREESRVARSADNDETLLFFFPSLFIFSLFSPTQ